MTYPIRPFTEGMIPVPMPAQPLWAFEARSAGNRAWYKAAFRGEDGEACLAAYQAAYDAVAKEKGA